MNYLVGNGGQHSVIDRITDSASDAFGRLRTSNPTTIFDSKQLYDNSPLFWDDQEESGSGTTSIHSVNGAATTMGVALNTIGKRTRQTFMRFNYQPGKSQLIYMTGIFNKLGGGTGITRFIGPHDDNNGLYFKDDEGILKVGIRSKASGVVVDNEKPQSEWNLDKLDGTGKSGVTLNLVNIQFFVFDFQWLAAGIVRFGVNVNDNVTYCHEFYHANLINQVYMSTPNLPLRYQIINDGTGVASSLVHICSSVISEGGVEENGILRYKSTAGVHLDANVADTLYALIGIRLKATALSCSISTIAASLVAETNDDFEWIILFNPVIAGTFTYIPEVNSCIEGALGVTANTVTGGIPISGGMAERNSIASASSIKSAKRLGAAIDGTPDELVLCVRPLGASANIQGSITWRELV